MKKIVRSRSFAVASLIVTFLAVIVPIVLFLVGHPSKSLSFSLIARSPLVDFPQAGMGDLEVSYRGEEIQSVQSITLLFENSGNASIPPQDFEKPMVVVLAEDCRVLSAEVADHSPLSLNPKISTAATSVAIAPLLLNANDRFALTVVVSGDAGVPKLDARIFGIRDVTTVDRRNPHLRSVILVDGMIGFLGIGLCFYLSGLAWFGRWHLTPNLRWYDFVGPVMALSAVSSFVLGRSIGVSNFSNIQAIIYLGVIVVLSAPLFFVAKIRVKSWYSADTTNDS